MTRKETDSIALPAGYWWWNVALLGESANWQMVIEPPSVDINDDRLFGYGKQEFLAKQYKG
jgi:hypothetical protein